jgi:hypothetical protein
MNGLIVSCPIIINGDDIKITRSALDPQELRFALMFWDRLSWPMLNGIQIHGGRDEWFLKDAGILERPTYSIMGKQAPAMLQAQIEHYKIKEKEKPGVWALGTGENSIKSADLIDEASSGTLISLLNSIPIPTSDVPLAEILEFRQRRRPELLSFREHLALMISEISGANDSEQELKNKIAQLDAACANLIETTKEWQSPVYLADFKASINFDLKKILGSGLAAFKIGQELNLGLTSTTVMTLGAGALGTLSLSKDIKFRPAKLETSPYKYAYHIQKEFMI